VSVKRFMFLGAGYIGRFYAGGDLDGLSCWRCYSSY
jgi:hypothetical protein